MRPGNIAALVCLVGAFALLSSGLAIAIGGDLKGPMQIIAQYPGERPGQQELAGAVMAYDRSTIFIMTFLTLGIPGILLAGLGCGLRVAVGRKQDYDLEREITQQGVRERLLQGFLTEWTEAVVDADALARRTLNERRPVLLERLDPLRRARLEMGFRAAEAPTTTFSAAAVPTSRQPPVRPRPLLAYSLVSILGAGAALTVLWGGVSMAILSLSKAARDHAYTEAGLVSFGKPELVVVALGCSIIALTLLAFAAGLWVLHRRDCRLAERWLGAWEATQEQVLEHCRARATGLLARSAVDGEGRALRRACVRGLALASVPELDGARRRRLREILSDSGYDDLYVLGQVARLDSGPPAITV